MLCIYRCNHHAANLLFLTFLSSFPPLIKSRAYDDIRDCSRLFIVSLNIYLRSDHVVDTRGDTPDINCAEQYKAKTQ